MKRRSSITVVPEGMKVTDNDTDPAEKLLLQAREIVAGARRQAYGNPEDNFGTIAALWDAYLRRRHLTGNLGDYMEGRTNITATDVAAMMALMKVARLAESPQHADSWRDLAGYAACGARTSGADLG
jgi:hypothetical protein